MRTGRVPEKLAQAGAYYMFVGLIGDYELFFFGLIACLLCGVAIGWVARDCSRRPWADAPNDQGRTSPGEGALAPPLVPQSPQGDGHKDL